MKTNKKPRLHFTDGEAVIECRQRLRRSQAEFWAPLGVTQSGGSRYESGRDIPEPVQLLLEIAYGTECQATAVAESLRSEQVKLKAQPLLLDDLSPEEKQLITLWRRADNRLQKVIMATAKLAR